MMKTRSSLRISSAIASRRASRTVCVFVLPSQSGSGGSGRAEPGMVTGSATAKSAVNACAEGASVDDCATASSSSGRAVSPSSNNLAITAPTATPSLPSATVISPTIPSSTASTSIVALSVSISAMTSPDLTLSPAFTSHLDNRPSVIVGDNAGILIFTAIFKSFWNPLCSNNQNICEQLI